MGFVQRDESTGSIGNHCILFRRSAAIPPEASVIIPADFQQTIIFLWERAQQEAGLSIPEERSQVGGAHWSEGMDKRRHRKIFVPVIPRGRVDARVGAGYEDDGSGAWCVVKSS